MVKPTKPRKARVKVVKVEKTSAEKTRVALELELLNAPEPPIFSEPIEILPDDSEHASEPCLAISGTWITWLKKVWKDQI
jgi:hypothetical protein